MLNDYLYKGLLRPQRQTLPLKIKGSIERNFWQGNFVAGSG